MPSNWAMIDNSFPAFDGKESPRIMIAALQNYLAILVEQLKYQLNNLSNANWNETALENLKSMTTEGVEREMTNLAGDLSSAVETLTTIAAKVQRAEEALAYQERAQGEQSAAIANLQERMDDADADIGNLMAVLHPDGYGGALIGGEGKEIRLVGKVYINGILIEGGEV